MVGTACASCGTQLRAGAKFCDECGAAATHAGATAEYKQVTVLFADVVHSMEIAAKVGSERLRELMSDLFDRCADVVQRYGGTVDKFTGDGIMAIFGAPVALEDHAIRACVAALEIQQGVDQLTVGVRDRDDIDFLLRVGLNSGEVIAGEVGSRAGNYTTIGAQVGMAQRMESAAPPGGVMLSESTARLVEGETVLGRCRRVQIKGAAEPVPGYPLMSMTGRHADATARATTLVGRDWELAALQAMLERSIAGHGCVVCVVGPAGIGKSRTVAETTAAAKQHQMQVFSTYCESHTSDVAFQAATRMLRSAFGVDGVASDAARTLLHSAAPDADPVDLILLQDELGIRDAVDALPDIAAEARRRRLTALVNATVLARQDSALFVIEDAHWIDPTSEALLADFLGVIPRTNSMAIITFRPEYSGALRRIPGAQTIALAPLDDSQIAGLITELLGTHLSVTGLPARIAERASGNPFFVEQIVRHLVDRGVLRGERGAYVCEDDATDVDVPPTVQAAIAARIDRLTPEAKNTLNAAAVIGLRFDEALLTALVAEPVLDPLCRVELVDQVTFTPGPRYAFRHPLIRAVAYRSQLTSVRAGLHRRLAVALSEGDSASTGEDAALIAEHYEAAGVPGAAFEWHMRAGEVLRFRDIHASRVSWRRAAQVADTLPTGTAGRDAMRIAPRTLLTASAFRANGPVDDDAFEELRQLTGTVGDKLSLATAMAGRVTALAFRGRYRDSSVESDEILDLIEVVGEPAWELTLLTGPSMAKLLSGQIYEGLRLADRMIDVADGDYFTGGFVIESPLTVAIVLRAAARMCLGADGWRAALDEAEILCRKFAPVGESVAVSWKYGLAVAMGAVRADTEMIDAASGILTRAEQIGDDLAVVTAEFNLGYCLAHIDGPMRKRGLALLANVRAAAVQHGAIAACLPMADIETAKQRADEGDTTGAVEMLSSLRHNDLLAPGFDAIITEALVETLIERGDPTDLVTAQNEVECLASSSTEPGFVFPEIVLLRLQAQLARARGDDRGYHDVKERYRAAAVAAGYESHIVKAEAML